MEIKVFDTGHRYISPRGGRIVQERDILRYAKYHWEIHVNGTDTKRSSYFKSCIDDYKASTGCITPGYESCSNDTYTHLMYRVQSAKRMATLLKYTESCLKNIASTERALCLRLLLDSTDGKSQHSKRGGGPLSPSLLDSTDGKSQYCLTRAAIKSFNLEIQRNYKYWRSIRWSRLSYLNGEDLESTNDSLKKRFVLDENACSQVPIFCRGSVAKWKNGAGRKKDWKINPFTGSPKSHDIFIHGWHEKGLSSLAVMKARMNTFRLLAAAPTQSVIVPQNMPRIYKRKQNSCALTPFLRMPRDIERQPRAGCKISRPYRRKPLRRGKRNSQIEAKDIISDDISFHHSLGSIRISTSAADIEDEDSQDTSFRDKLAQSHVPASLNWKDGMMEKTCLYASRTFTIPYESHIGAIIAGYFVLRGFIRAEPCYDVHAAKGFNTDMKYIAKAYSISGQKGKVREYRLKNLKRNVAKASCVASIDQNKIKWVFFPMSSDPNTQINTSSDPWALHGKQQYQRHFPSLSPCCIASSAEKQPFMRSYASVVQRAQVETKDRSTGKNQRARDRQRRKRQEKRAIKAAARGSLEGQEASAAERPNPSDPSRCPPICREKSCTGNDMQQEKERQDPHNFQEPAKGKLNSPPMQFVPVAEPHDSDVASPTRISRDGGSTAPFYESESDSPWQEVHSKHQRSRRKLPRVTKSEPFDVTRFEHYLQAFDQAMGGRDHDANEEIWQRLILGPAVNFKNRFFEIIAQRDKEFEEIGKSLIHSQQEQDQLLLSRFLRAASLNRAYKNDYSKSESDAFEYLLPIFYKGNDNSSKAMQLLCQGADQKVIPMTNPDTQSQNSATYKLMRKVVMQDDFGRREKL
ncbi:hypothetical protein GJ744_011456 [Endocarpon pusillum]|uniref:YAG7-like dimerisation domain-containing protein n=1 Tax=Endocarpon pusillum TaxID=364733 RepID=A0A8H7AF78_9EURO|nr:hypothetical protein GJ744_011456 [Endocarpon pusillum]